MTFFEDLEQQKEYDYIVKGIKNFLEFYNLDREDFLETPQRVARMIMTFMNQPTSCEMKHFPTSSEGGIICIKDFHAWSFCPHHLLPVKYDLKIGYVPNGRALGLSKLGRAVQCTMSMLPLQEDIGMIVAEEITKSVNPKGIGILVKGEHMCMQMRGLSDPCVCAASDYYTGIMTSSIYQERFLKM